MAERAVYDVVNARHDVTQRRWACDCGSSNALRCWRCGVCRRKRWPGLSNGQCIDRALSERYQ